MKLLVTGIFILFSSSFLFAQRRCATQEVVYTANDDVQKNVFISRNSRDTLADEVITIPVVIHIIYKDGAQNISDAQVLSQLASLNRDFRRSNADIVNTPMPFRSVAADCKINFCLARVDPRGRPTSGIIRKQTGTSAFLVNDDVKFTSAGGDDAWDSHRYLNIWVCNLLGRNLGYATFPGGAADRDGIVIQFDVFGTTGNVHAPYNKGRTVTHEIGHWLGLKHIWGDADCGTDDIADTPPQRAYSNGCPSFPQTSGCSVNSSGDMFMNYMDFTDDACMNLFTLGQKVKMRSLFAIGSFRNSFLNSNACDSSQAENAPLPVVPVAASMELNVFPNPAHATLTVELKNSIASKRTLKVLNSSGIVVKHIEITGQVISFDINSLPTGVYIVVIEDGKSKLLKKLMKL